MGRLTVNGNYTQNASGTLRIEVAGLAPGQHDVLVVNGQASLAGTVQLVRVGPSTSVWAIRLRSLLRVAG